jgi:hypothetical protein
MNTKLLKSKKFRAAVLAAISGILTFCVSKLGWSLDVSETMGLLSTVTVPFLLYIGAEGFSEVQAKKVIEENKVREDITNKVLEEIVKQQGEITTNEK